MAVVGVLGSVTDVNRTRALDYPWPVPPRNRPTSDAAAPEQPGSGKGRPTPRRRVVEAARRRPLVPDRKAYSKAKRTADRATRDREYQAMLTGDDRHLPARDKGPVRRWIRDHVDARRNLGEYFLPVSIALVVATFLAGQNAAAALAVIVLLYVAVISALVDAFILSRVLRKRLAAKFGAEKVPRGALMYGVLRAFQMRRTRLPRPQVARGQYPI